MSQQPLSSDRRWRCQFCPKKFDDLSECMTHEEEHRRQIAEEEKLAQEKKGVYRLELPALAVNPRKKFVCFHANKAFNL